MWTGQPHRGQYCLEPSCLRKAKVKGFCFKHYQYRERHGTLGEI